MFEASANGSAPAGDSLLPISLPETTGLDEKIAAEHLMPRILCLELHAETSLAYRGLSLSFAC